MSLVIRCLRCYERVEYDGQAHTDARGLPCKPAPVWPLPVLMVTTWLVTVGLLVWLAWSR